MDWLNPYGLLFTLVLLIPNLLFAYTHKGGFENKFRCKAVEIGEQIGRFGCFGMMLLNLPFLRPGYWLDAGETLYLVGGALFVLLYCAGWLVFWKTDSLAKAITLSVLPSLLFFWCGILPLHLPLLAFSLLFAPCHILISVKNSIL